MSEFDNIRDEEKYNLAVDAANLWKGSGFHCQVLAGAMIALGFVSDVGYFYLFAGVLIVMWWYCRRQHHAWWDAARDVYATAVVFKPDREYERRQKDESPSI